MTTQQQATELNPIEATILNAARQTVKEFNSFVTAGALEAAQRRSSSLGGLTMLAKLQDSGLSESAVIELKQMDKDVSRVCEYLAV